MTYYEIECILFYICFTLYITLIMFILISMCGFKLSEENDCKLEVISFNIVLCDCG
jgi:hypothetical protein